MPAESNNKKQLYRSLLALMVPITIQNLLGALVNSADVLMLGYVGQNELAAVSLANQYMFLLWGFFFGISSAEVLMNAQYWGKGDLRAVQAVFGIGLKLSLGLTAIVAALCLFLPEQMMALYTNDAELIAIGTGYLRICGISYLLMSFGEAYRSMLRSVEQAVKSAVISTAALLTNVVLNAVFIFGLFGMPKLGVKGVAIATVIARSLEMVICLADYLRGKVFRADLKLLLGRHPVLSRDFVKYAGPSLLNDLIWTLAFSTYSIILGHLSNDMVAASSVATTVRELLTTACFGIGSAGTVIVGKDLGMNEMERAKSDASTILRITIVFTAFTGMALILLRRPFAGLFALSETAYGYLDQMLIISSYYIMGQAINTFLIAGVFRAGGNTRFGLICDAIVMWCVSVPLGFASAFLFKLPPMTVYFILCLDEFWKMPTVFRYYKSYRWVNNITHDDAV